MQIGIGIVVARKLPAQAMAIAVVAIGLAGPFGCTLTRRQPWHNEVSAIAFSPNGKTIAVGRYKWRTSYATPRFLITKVQQTVTLHDAVTGMEVQRVDDVVYPGKVPGLSPETQRWIAFSPDGLLLAIGCWDGKIKFWDTQTHEIRWTIESDGARVSTLAFSADGRHLAIASRSHLEIRSSTEFRRTDFVKLPPEMFSATSLSFSPDGKQLAVGAPNGVAIVDLASMAVVRLLASDRAEHDEAIEHAADASTPELSESVAFSPDGAVLAVGGEAYRQRRNFVRLVHVATDNEHRPTRSVNFAGIVAFAPDGQSLAVGGGAGVHVIDVNSALQHLFLPTADAVRALDYSPDGRSIAVGDVQGIATVWNGQTGERLWANPPTN